MATLKRKNKETGEWEFVQYSGVPSTKTGTTAPVDNADFIGQDFIDTTNKKVYTSVSTGNGSLDWVILN